MRLKWLRLMSIVFLVLCSFPTGNLFSQSGDPFYPEAKIKPADLTTWDHFGWSVAISGDRMVVGAVVDGSATANFVTPYTYAGSVYVYKYDGTQWVQEAKLVPHDSVPFDLFGISVSISGDRLIVGAVGDEESGPYVGSAYIFRYDGTQWVEEAKLVPPGAIPENFFGASVSISGDTAVVGAFLDEVSVNDSGAVYVYRFNGSSWVQEAVLTPNDASSQDGFGWSVSISGDRLVAGAVSSYGNSYITGAAYVFQYTGSEWTQEAKLKASDGMWGDAFGISVSISGDTIAVGAFQDDNTSADTGSVYVFSLENGTWTEDSKLIAGDRNANDKFGNSVSVDGDVVVVGAFQDSDASFKAGAAYVFRKMEGMWYEESKFYAGNIISTLYFGNAVAINGGRFAVGAWHDGDNGLASSGAVYVYSDGSSISSSPGSGMYINQAGPGTMYSGAGSNSILSTTLAANGNWQIDCVYCPLYEFTGKGINSMVLDSNNYPHVIYNGDSLYYLRFDGSSWTREKIEDNVDTDVHNSIALDSSGNPHVVYYIEASKVLKYAYKDGTSWYKETIESGDEIGLYPVLVLDSLNNPHVSYYNLKNTSLKYAYKDGVAWSKETVDSGGETGLYNSLALDSLDRPHIGYYNSSDNALNYAYLDGHVWRKETIDSAGEVGKYPSLALDSMDRPHISYYDVTDSRLKYAHYDGVSWLTEVIVNNISNVFNPYTPRLNTYKGQLHAHTTNSDGNSTPYAVQQAYKMRGYSFLAISDHDFVTPSPNVPGILHISSVEETTSYLSKSMFYQFHINTPGNSGSQNTKTNPQDIIDDIVAQGGGASLNHPGYEMYPTLMPLTNKLLLKLKGYSTIELNNDIGGEARWFYMLSNNRRVWGVAVDDSHSVNQINNGWIMLNADNLTETDVMASLKSGNFYPSTGNSLSVSLNGTTITATTTDLSTIQFKGKNSKTLKNVPSAYSATYTLSRHDKYVVVKAIRISDKKLAYSNPFYYSKNIATLKLDASDRPHFVYQDTQNLNVKYMYKYGNIWLTETIEDSPDAGMYISFLVDSYNIPHIVYLSSGNIKYAQRIRDDNDDDGYDLTDGDCDDSNPDIHPNAIETCDGLDTDCDGLIPFEDMDWDIDGYPICAGDCDDNDPVLNPVTYWYVDNDGDTYGNGSVWVQQCSVYENYVLRDGDCDDNNNNISLGGPSVRIPAEPIVYHTSIQDAYNEAADGIAIEVKDDTLSGDLNIDLDKTITLDGGYNCDFSNNNSYTVLNGNMIISDGMVVISNIVVD